MILSRVRSLSPNFEEVKRCLFWGVPVFAYKIRIFALLGVYAVVRVLYCSFERVYSVVMIS